MTLSEGGGMWDKSKSRFLDLQGEVEFDRVKEK